MEISFDPAKDAANRRKHGIPLSLASRFDLSTAQARLDDREDYGEDRYIATGFIGANLYTLVYTLRQDIVRPISLRDATKQERREHAEGD